MCIMFLLKTFEIPLLLVFLGEVDTFCGSVSAAIRINLYIEKNQETLYTDRIGSHDQMHHVSIKILEIPLLLVFLEQFFTRVPLAKCF